MKQIYQPLLGRQLLQKEQYFAPYGAQNTEGNVVAAYALFQLTDPVVGFTRLYSRTAASFSQSYKLMLNKINTHGTAEQVLANAIKKIENDEFAALGPHTQKFFLVETLPYNLFAEDEMGQEISFTVGPADSNADYVGIGTEAKHEVTFNGFTAHINRPWLELEVFGKKKWTIKGCEKGVYSDGNYANKGRLPLIPAQLLIAIDSGKRYLVGVISDIIPLTPMLSYDVINTVFANNMPKTAKQRMADIPPEGIFFESSESSESVVSTEQRLLSTVLVDEFGNALPAN